MALTILGDKNIVVARGGRSFAPQLDILLPIVIERTYFPEISRSSRLPAYMGPWKLVGDVGIESVCHALG